MASMRLRERELRGGERPKTIGALKKMFDVRCVGLSVKWKLYKGVVI